MPKLADHCDNHEDQVKALAGIDGGINTLKWVVSITLPVMTIVIITFFTIMNNKLSSINQSVNYLTTGQKVTEAKLEVQEKAISEIKDRLAMLEARKGMQ